MFPLHPFFKYSSLHSYFSLFIQEVEKFVSISCCLPSQIGVNLDTQHALRPCRRPSVHCDTARISGPLRRRPPTQHLLTVVRGFSATKCRSVPERALSRLLSGSGTRKPLVAARKPPRCLTGLSLDISFSRCRCRRAALCRRDAQPRTGD